MNPSPVTRKLRLVPALLTAGLSFALQASAQTTFTKADNTTSLNLAGSYTANSGLPGASDTILIDNTLTANRTSALGGNLSIYGITMNAAPVSNVARQFQINATTGATLTIMGGGITKASNTSALILNPAIALGANQTWSIASVSGTGTGNLQLNSTSLTTNGYTLAVNGTGTLDIRSAGSLTLDSNVTIDTAVSINAAAAVVTLQGANTFNSLAIPSGRLIVNTIGNFGQASNAGDGGTNTAITLGNTTKGIFEYTGISTDTNRTFNRDARSLDSGIEVTTAGTTLGISGNLGSGTQTNSGTNGWVFGGAGNLKLSGAISNATGAGSTGTTITKNGTGTLTLAGTNTFTGAVTVTGGTLLVAKDAALSNAASVAVNNAGSTLAVNYGGTNDYTDTQVGTLLSKTTFGSTGAALAFDTTNATGAVSYNNALTHSAGFTKLGAGTLNLGGNNSYTGATTISAGTLGLASSERIANTSNLILTGGTFALNGHTETLGTLDLNGNSTIDLGSGGKLIFSDSSAVSWDTGMTLTIVGTLGADSIRFGSTSGALTSTQLGLFRMSGFEGFALDNNGYLTAAAIPEPSTYALLAGVAGLGLVIYRRRRDRQAAATVKVTTTL